MKKPKLEDYDLQPGDIAELENQIKEHKEKKSQIDHDNIIGRQRKTSAEAKRIYMSIIIGVAIDVSIILCFANSTNENWILYVGFFLGILGATIYVFIFNRTCDDLYHVDQECNYYDIVNKRLESNIIKFKEDSYNYYLSKINSKKPYLTCVVINTKAIEKFFYDKKQKYLCLFLRNSVIFEFGNVKEEIFKDFLICEDKDQFLKTILKKYWWGKIDLDILKHRYK